MPDSDNSYLDSPMDSPIVSKPVKKSPPKGSKKPSPSTASASRDSSFNLSDIDKLQTQYTQITGVAVKKTRGSTSANVSMEAPAAPLTKAQQRKAAAAAKKASKPMTAAALKKAETIKQKMMQDLLTKSKPPPPAEPPGKIVKARSRAAQKKLLAEQKRAEHEAFLREAFGLDQASTSSSNGSLSMQVRAMLNGVFGSDDGGGFAELAGYQVNDRSSRRLRQQDLEVIDLVSSPVLVLPGVVSLDSDDEDPVVVQANDKAAAVANSSFDADNYEISVKIKWEDRVIKETMRKVSERRRT
jgi:hypothetical protein